MKNKAGLKLIFSILVFSGILDIHAQELKNSDFLKNTVLIKASKIEPHPEWAIMQRHLMKTIEEAAHQYVKKFTQKDVTPFGKGP